MTEDRLQRRLSALVSADVVDYSRLMADDQIATIRSLKACRERTEEAVDQFGGRMSDFVGDNMLAEFPNARKAVECAVAIHRSLAEINRKLPVHRRIQFRIGIHLGDVMFDGRQLKRYHRHAGSGHRPNTSTHPGARPGPGRIRTGPGDTSQLPCILSGQSQHSQLCRTVHRSR